MFTLKLLSAAVLSVVVLASPSDRVALRGSANVSRVAPSSRIVANVSNTPQRRLEEEDPWKEYKEKAEMVSTGVDAVSDMYDFVDDASWKTAGKSIGSIGAVVATAVPPPAGIVAGGFMGLVGGLMSIFGPGTPPGPSNQDILDAMSAGFERVMKAVGEVSIKLDSLSGQVADIQDQLDELLTLQHKIYTNTVLQGSRIKLFMQQVAELGRRYDDASIDSRLFDDYQSYLFQMYNDWSDMQGSNGALGSANLAAMLDQIEATFKDSPRDYALVTQSVTLYRWMYQARASLLSVLMQASTLKHGNLTVQALHYTNTYIDDVNGYDDVLRSHQLGKAVSFSDSHAAACAATANSVMQMQGLSLKNFMHPYINLIHGDCSHPVGLVSPPWTVASGYFSTWPGREYYNDDASLQMLVDVNATECSKDLYWDGRTSLTNLNDKHIYVKDFTLDSPTESIELKFEYLGACPSPDAPWVQKDEDYIKTPGCGCRIYAEPKNTIPSYPMCRNTCYA